MSTYSEFGPDRLRFAGLIPERLILWPKKSLQYRLSAYNKESYMGCSYSCDNLLNPLIVTLKPQSNGPSYRNTVIGTLAVDGWAITFGTARRGLGGAIACPGPSSLYHM